jgi:hypothetical protein
MKARSELAALDKRLRKKYAQSLPTGEELFPDHLMSHFPASNSDREFAHGVCALINEQT